MPTIKGFKIIDGKIPEEIKKYITLPFKADNFKSTKDAGIKVEPIGEKISDPEPIVEPEDVVKATYTYAELKSMSKNKQVTILKDLGVKGKDIPALEEGRIKKILELSK